MQVALRKMGEQFTHGTREYEEVLQKRMKAAETQRREELTPLITGLAGQVQEMRAEVGKKDNLMNKLSILNFKFPDGKPDEGFSQCLSPAGSLQGWDHGR